MAARRCTCGWARLTLGSTRSAPTPDGGSADAAVDRPRDMRVRFFDAGGGTFDVLLLLLKGGVLEVKAITGYIHLGARLRGCEVDGLRGCGLRGGETARPTTVGEAGRAVAARQRGGKATRQRGRTRRSGEKRVRAFHLADAGKDGRVGKQKTMVESSSTMTREK